MASAPRLLFALLAMLLLATSANASRTAALPAPAGLHGFLFRADEPVRHEFARTPAFAWSPVRGATGYEFQLATSNTFRENGLVFKSASLKTPVVSVMLTLPWITGSPYSLYARVRATVGSRVTAWSEPFGFNMRQPNVAKPMVSFPGLLRWTPVEGALGYQLWLIDVNKKVLSFTNVLDERELYTFHQSAEWTSKVRWRIRTLRGDFSDETTGGRANGLPITSWGPWSPVYESSNPPLDTGTLRLVGTASDVFATGANADVAHRLMPSFVFSGTKGLDGTDAELFRVYVYTDSDCVNRVFAGAVVGSPAYSARSYGPIDLPRTTVALSGARGAYAPDGDQGTTYAADGEPIVPNESLAQPTLTTGLATSAAPTTTPAAPTTGDTSTGAGSTVKFLTPTGNWGAPVDLWDTNWPEGGYYWTVVPVEAVNPDALTTSVGEAAAIGATTLALSSTTGFATGDVLQIGNASNQENATVTAVNGNTVTLALALKQGHGVGEPVARRSGNLIYRRRCARAAA